MIVSTIAIFFGVLALLVLVHEWGHFFVARRFGVRIEEFGFGLPPRAFGIYRDAMGHWRPVGPKKKEAPNTIWSLNWIPLGGFVKIKGEQGELLTDPDSFGSRSIPKRIAIISAGVSMNLILAVVLLTIGFMIGSPQEIGEKALPPSARISSEEIVITDVLPATPADQAGIKIGDRIISIDGQTFDSVTGLQEYVNGRANQSLAVKIARSSQTLDLSITPINLPEADGRAVIGVAFTEVGIVSLPWYSAWRYGILETLRMIGGILVGFYLIIKQLIGTGQLIGDVYGPVGIATLVGQTAQLGFIYLLQFTAILSVIIAVINFLPFPALDGGRVVFLIIEGIRGKAVNPRVEAVIHNIGFALLMLLMLLVTFRDVIRIWPS